MKFSLVSHDMVSSHVLFDNYSEKVSVAKPTSQFLISEKDNDLMRKESFEAFGKWGNKEKGEEWRGGGGCWL